jgi:hypothetical protein
MLSWTCSGSPIEVLLTLGAGRHRSLGPAIERLLNERYRP